MPTYQKTLREHRWFFILISVGVLFLFWKIISPFAVILLTAGIAAIVFSPLQDKLQKLIKSRRLSAFIIILGVFLVILLPLLFLTLNIIQQASDLLKQSFSLDIASHPLFLSLPEFVQSKILTFDLAVVATAIADWAVKNLGSVFSSTAQLLLNIVIFFIALYYFLIDRKKIYAETLKLSPFQDQLDKNIVSRIVHTVRSVVLGALIVAITQGILAGIGMTIFGVPGALIWGALAIIAAQIPFVGVGLIMAPAIGFLFLTGSTTAGIGLLIWSVIVVGLVDNFLSPLLLEGKTNMHALLILVSILGGIQFFGSIGFIIGPTVLAAVMVIVELYKVSLEKSTEV